MLLRNPAAFGEHAFQRKVLATDDDTSDRLCDRNLERNSPEQSQESYRHRRNLARR